MTTSQLMRRTAMGAVALLALATAACGSDAGSGSSPKDGPHGKTIAFVGFGSQNPWANGFNEVYVAAMKDAGVKINDLTTLEPGVQVQNMNQAIAQKPDLIVLGPLDPKALVVPVQKAHKAGIPILTFDSKVDTSVEDLVMSVSSNHCQLGEFAAENLIEGLKAQGRAEANIIAVTGTAAQQNTIERVDCFKKKMESAPEYKVIAFEDGNWDPTKSGQVASQLLAKYGKDGVQGAWGMADYQAIPIIQSAKQLGIPVGGEKGLVVTGSNCFKSGIDAIRAGTLYGTATQDPSSIAKEVAQYTLDHFNGKDLEQHVLAQHDRITAANVDEFAEQCTF